METYIITITILVIALAFGYLMGTRNKRGQGSGSELTASLQAQITELDGKLKDKEACIATQQTQLTSLTSERDVQRTLAENYQEQLEKQAKEHEQQIAALRSDHDKQLLSQKADTEKALQDEHQHNAKRETELKDAYEQQIAALKDHHDKQLLQVKENAEKQMKEHEQQVASLRNDHDKLLQSQKDDAEKALLEERQRNAKRETELKDACEQQISALRIGYDKQLASQKADTEKALQDEHQRNAKREAELKDTYEQQVATLKDHHDKQLLQAKENAEKEIAALHEMNKEQVESQLKLIKEQMQTTSEEILKRRQNELGEQNKEQVSKIIDPLQQSLKAMQEAFDKTKEQQHDALTRLDATIKLNMEKSAALGETADRLTRALTGEVKVQGNFGELKLKQLLEDLELREGEQFDTQETLRDKGGRAAKGDDGRGLIPDFILHFPNNRHVVVDSKMSLTDYERYMNSEDGTPEKTESLKAHIASVRAQVKRLARKEYTKYLPDGYNRLNFAIMYVPIEGALNLALLNDATLWREAYDEGVMILGPQTMYMNLRVLEMMWTQVRQLKNQQAMMDAANSVIDRVQDFGIRFIDVESSVNDTVKKIAKLKISTAEGGPSIITAARKLLKAGASENKKKKSLSDMDDTMFLDGEPSALPQAEPTQETRPEESPVASDGGK